MTVALRAGMPGRGAARPWWGDGAAMAFYISAGAESDGASYRRILIGAADDTFAAEAET